MSKQTKQPPDALLEAASREALSELLALAETDCGETVSKEEKEQIILLCRSRQMATRRRKRRKILLIACVAALLSVLVSCVAIPTVREKLWQIVLDWSDDGQSVKIDFVPADDQNQGASTDPAVTASNDPSGTTTVQPTDEPDTPAVTPPTSIEEVNAPSYIPEGYTVAETYQSRKMYMLSYYNAEGEDVLTFAQIIVTADSEGDAAEATATNIKINGLNAVLFTYADQPNVYNLYWQDDQYRYNIYGLFQSYDELIKMATSVAVK